MCEGGSEGVSKWGSGGYGVTSLLICVFMCPLIITLHSILLSLRHSLTITVCAVQSGGSATSY